MEQEVERVLEDRQKEYGDATPNFTAIGRGWGALLPACECGRKSPDLPAWLVALFFDFAKSVRITKNPAKKDSWVDKHGYTHHGEIAVG